MEYIFTCQPTSESLAKEEIDTRDDMTFVRWLDGNVGMVDIEGQLYQEQAPIFVRHVFPILETFTKEQRREEVVTFGFAHLDFEQPFALHIRGQKEERETMRETSQLILQSLEEAGYQHDPKQAIQILSLYVTDTGIFAGYSTKSENLSEWNGGEVHLSPKGTISRAELKLEEVFIEMEGLPDSGRALDLGAAPGGWTHFLLNKGFRVTAVDPAKMDPAVRVKEMKHYKMVTQQFIREIPKKEYALIVNDMKMDIWESIEIMMDFTAYLTDEGVGVITLKLPKRVRYHTIQKVLGTLEKGFRVLKAKQLFHNRSEITVILGKK